MIALTKLRDLDLLDLAGRRTHVSAASGLVRIGGCVYVVIDDELHLGAFPAGSNAPGRLIPLFESELPFTNPERKAQKPDLESLCGLPPFGDFPRGALLALGSGSTAKRRRGVLLALDGEGAVDGSPQVVDLTGMYRPLDTAFPALNIEGAVVIGNELRLFQRGNKRNSENAVVRFSLSGFLAALDRDSATPIEPLAIHSIDLGGMNGIPFCFTDAAALADGHVVFTAIAEDTDDTYNDGPCMGAAIGVLNPENEVRRFLRLDGPYKIEGIDARLNGDTIEVQLVTDADDPSIPAVLYAASLKL